MQEPQVLQEQETSKIIKVVETPEDLYIIGQFPQMYYDLMWKDRDAEGTKGEAARLLDKNFHSITDDYHSLDLKGKAKEKTQRGIETCGSYALLTESELKFITDNYPIDEILEMYDDWDAEFDSKYRRDHYAMRILKYVGEITLAMLDHDDASIDYLLEYDNKEDGVLYCKMSEPDGDRRSASPALICESGFSIDFLGNATHLWIQRS